MPLTDNQGRKTKQCKCGKFLRCQNSRKWIAALVLVLLLLSLFLGSRAGGSEDAPEPSASAVPTTVPTEAPTVPTTVPTVPETEPVEETVPETTEAVTRQRIHYDAVPRYFQTDYPNVRYGRGTVASSGCGITCLAMVASYMTGHEYLPDELADYFGGYGQNNMQKIEYGSDMLQLPWKKMNNVDEVLAEVDKGCLAIVMMNEESMFSDSDHFIVIAGKTEDGKYLVNDPMKYNYDLWGLKQGFENGFERLAIVMGYSGGWVYDVSAMPEDPFIYEEIKPYVEPRYPNIQLTPDEVELLARVIWVEARGESFDGQQAVAEVVFNRMLSKDYPNDMKEILYDHNQFPSVEHLEKAEPTQAQYDAIDDALNGPYVLPVDVLHFATYAVNDKVWGTIGGHTFCYRWDIDEVTEPTQAVTEPD